MHSWSFLLIYGLGVLGHCTARTLSYREANASDLVERNTIILLSITGFISIGTLLSICACCRQRRKHGFEEFKNETVVTTVNGITEYPIFRALTSPEPQSSSPEVYHVDNPSFSPTNAVSSSLAPLVHQIPIVSSSSTTAANQHNDNQDNRSFARLDFEKINSPLFSDDKESIENSNVADTIPLASMNQVIHNEMVNVESPSINCNSRVLSPTASINGAINSSEHIIVNANYDAEPADLSIEIPMQYSNATKGSCDDVLEKNINSFHSYNIPRATTATKTEITDEKVFHQKYCRASLENCDQEKNYLPVVLENIDSINQKSIQSLKESNTLALETNVGLQATTEADLLNQQNDDFHSVEEALRALDNVLADEDSPTQEQEHHSSLHDTNEVLSIEHSSPVISFSWSELNQAGMDTVVAKNSSNEVVGKSTNLPKECFFISGLNQQNISTPQTNIKSSWTATDQPRVMLEQKLTHKNLFDKSSPPDVAGLEEKHDFRLLDHQLNCTYISEELNENTSLLSDEAIYPPDIIDNDDHMVDTSLPFIVLHDEMEVGLLPQFMPINNQTFDLIDDATFNARANDSSGETHEMLEDNFRFPSPPAITIDKEEENSSVDLTTVTPVNTPSELNYSVNSWDKIISQQAPLSDLPRSTQVNVADGNLISSTTDASVSANNVSGGWFLHPQQSLSNSNQIMDQESEQDEQQNLDSTFDALRKQLAAALPHAQGQGVTGPPDYSDDEESTTPNDTLVTTIKYGDVDEATNIPHEIVINYKHGLSTIMEESEEETGHTFIMNETRCLDSTSTGYIETGEAIMGVAKTLMASNDTLFNLEDALGDRDGDLFSPRTASRTEQQYQFLSASPCPVVASAQTTHSHSLDSSQSGNENNQLLNHEKTADVMISKESDQMIVDKSIPIEQYNFKPLEFLPNLKGDVLGSLIQDCLSPDQARTFSEEINTLERSSSDLSACGDHDMTFTTNTIEERTCISAVALGTNNTDHIFGDERLSEISEPDWSAINSSRAAAVAPGSEEIKIDVAALNQGVVANPIDNNMDSLELDIEMPHDDNPDKNDIEICDIVPYAIEECAPHRAPTFQASTQFDRLVLINFLMNEIEYNSSQCVAFCNPKISSGQMNRNDGDLLEEKKNGDDCAENRNDSDFEMLRGVNSKSIKATTIRQTPESLQQCDDSKMISPNVLNCSDDQTGCSNFSKNNDDSVSSKINAVPKVDGSFLVGNNNGDIRSAKIPVGTPFLATQYLNRDWVTEEEDDGDEYGEEEEEEEEDSNSSEEFMYLKCTPQEPEPLVLSPVKTTTDQKLPSLSRLTHLTPEKIEHNKIHDKSLVETVGHSEMDSIWSKHKDKIPIAGTKDVLLRATDDSSADSSTDIEEEFTPSIWDSMAMPARSVLKSPDKSSSEDDSKNTKKRRSVAFKKQRYHSIYEYPREMISLSPSYSEPQIWHCDLNGHNVCNVDFATGTDKFNGFTISSSTRPFHGSQFNVQCNTWPSDADFSWSKIEDDMDSNTVVYSKTGDLSQEYQTSSKSSLGIAEVEAIDDVNDRVESVTRPDSGVGESAELLTESLSLGDLCHTKSSLRLPLLNIEKGCSNDKNIESSPFNGSLPIAASQLKTACDDTDQTNLISCHNPAPSCTDSMNSVSSCSSGSERVASFTTFGKTSNMKSCTNANALSGVLNDRKLCPESAVDGNDDLTLVPSENQKELQKCNLKATVLIELHEQNVTDIIIEQNSLLRNEKRFDNRREKSVRVSDSTDEDSGIENMMRIVK